MKPNAEEILEQKKSGMGFRARVWGSSGSVFLPARIEPDFRKNYFWRLILLRINSYPLSHFSIYFFTWKLSWIFVAHDDQKKILYWFRPLEGAYPWKPPSGACQDKKESPF